MARSLCPARNSSSTTGEVLRLAPTNTDASRLAPKAAYWLVLAISLSTPVSGVNSRRLFNWVRSSGKLRYRMVLPSAAQLGVPMPPEATFSLGRRWDGLPRRDRRAAFGPAGEAAARAAGERGAPGGSNPRGSDLGAGAGGRSEEHTSEL